MNSARPKGTACFLRARHPRTPPPLHLYETLAFCPTLASPPNKCFTSKTKPHGIYVDLVRLRFTCRPHYVRSYKMPRHTCTATCGLVVKVKCLLPVHYPCRCSNSGHSPTAAAVQPLWLTGLRSQTTDHASPWVRCLLLGSRGTRATLPSTCLHHAHGSVDGDVLFGLRDTHATWIVHRQASQT